MIGKLKAGLFIVSGLIIFYFYLYVNNMREQLDLEIAQRAKTELIIQDLNNSISSVKKDLKEAGERLKIVEQKRKETREELDKVINTLSKHNIDKIQSRKPEQLRKIYEKGLNKYYSDIRNIMEN